MFLAHFHPELVGPLDFYISKNDTWAWDRPNLDQGGGSAWTRDGSQPGPGTGLSLDQARASAWASVAHVGHGGPG